MEIICYGCGRGEQPENTLEGIRHCQDKAPNWRIEMDIQLTKDGQLVLFHDETTERVTMVNKAINELDLKEAQALDVGRAFKEERSLSLDKYKMPTLEAVFQEFPTIKLMLDIHTNNYLAVDKTIDLIEKYELSSLVIIASHYDEVITLFKQKRPNWIYGVPTKEAKKIIYSSFFYLDGLFPISSDILMIPLCYGKIKVLTKRVIKHVKKRKKKLWVWWLESDTKVLTIENKNQLEVMEKLGVDGVFTAFPKHLMEEIKSQK